MSRLPPLRALQAFDAAARCRSFTAAARELHVTHGAVSRQVQLLEQFLGRTLFRRLPRGLQPTAHGHTLAMHTQQLFSQLGDVVDDIRAPQPDRRFVTISTVASLAARWLVPRLHSFQTANPDLAVRVSATPALVDFGRDDVDLALRYGLGNWPGLHSELLFDPREFPVCSPAVLRDCCELVTPDDLAQFTLLHDTTRAHWRAWLKLAGATAVDAGGGLVVEDMNVLLQAAIEGQGVALASGPLVAADLAAGRLVRPFDIELPVAPGFYLVCPRRYAERPHVARVMDWLRAQAVAGSP